jgi:glycerol kinase
MSFLASLDQSTTSTKFSIFTPEGELVAKHLLEHKQITPAEGLLEHDPLEIIENVRRCIEGAVEKAGKAVAGFESSLIVGVGVTNQRETVVCWDQSGKPLHNAIVWCDNRCQDICESFKGRHGEKFKQRTGLPVSTYFTLFKILWLIEHVPAIREGVEEGSIRFGTIDTWVIYNLTG